MKSTRMLRHFCLVFCLIGLAATGAVAAENAPVNINTATVEELTQLKGVGQAKAEAIVAWREQHGPFKAAQQLTEVKGIGDKLVETNRPQIVIE